MPRSCRRLDVLLALSMFGALLWPTALAVEQERPATETTAGWVKSPRNPVLGGDLGTCFDVSVLKEGDAYRMWFSWRPKKSIALVESRDGIELVQAGHRPGTQRQDRLGGRHQPPGRHQGRRHLSDVVHRAGTGRSWIGYATSRGREVLESGERPARPLGGSARGRRWR